MDKIRVDTGKLSGTESAVRAQLKGIRDALNKMQSDVSALNAMWTGEANQAFNQTFQKDIRDLDALCSEIQAIADFEHHAHDEYVKCEHNVSDIINAINISG